MEDAGFQSPKEIQEKSLSRIMGGQDLIIVGPEGCGKSTLLVLAVLKKLNYAFEEAPRALILVPDKETGLELEEKFSVLGKNSNLRVLALYAGYSIESQRDDIADGVDIVIGTPDRIQAIYYTSGINLNKLQMYILEDAEKHVKQGFKTQILQLHESMRKCQKLVFTEVIHDKLNKITEPLLNVPTVIESEEEPEEKLDIINQVVYQVPNYKTKLNLLNLLMADADIFNKVAVFANTRTTTENLYKSLSRRIPGEVAMFRPSGSANTYFDYIEDFLQSPEVRVLLIANEAEEDMEASHFPVILHFDLPENPDVLVKRILANDDSQDKLSLIFTTDIELILVKKAEQLTGHKFALEDLPLGLIIEGDPHSNKRKKESKASGENTEGLKRAAFHEKKPENAKDYNYSFKDKLKMFGKKHRKNKKL
ncbi:DEAD/DEAH box helicase [Cytophagaceae bacterium ABcell3]|nr:DEAD/DEAH box helicase [Cytophagaceae bacterium ABcell3]